MIQKTPSPRRDIALPGAVSPILPFHPGLSRLRTHCFSLVTVFFCFISLLFTLVNFLHFLYFCGVFVSYDHQTCAQMHLLIEMRHLMLAIEYD